jgi:hypothetical protein
VAHDTPTKDDPIIPGTVKYRVKHGQVDKLKTRIALSGDMMKHDTFVHSTWCPIAGFRALKIFLAFAAECRQRVYQLDFVAAFLQAQVIGRKFIKFPPEWKELLNYYPDLHQWIGMPLHLKIALPILPKMRLNPSDLPVLKLVLPDYQVKSPSTSRELGMTSSQC